ncbi:MAG TPA: metallophosphoesterase [Verrucomicrobiae bacterium]
MNTPLTRRRFLQLSTASTLALSHSLQSAEPAKSFAFVLLGDLHFDRLEHHDMAWLEKHKGGDLGQIKNYSRITADLMPRLFATVRESIKELNTTSSPVPFVLQVGDLVEGLCGTEELAARQNREALDFIKESKLGAPFLFTKGNHDVTGDGALPAFQQIFHPYLAEQARPFQGPAKLDSGNYTFAHQNAQFFCFDAYDKLSLDWLEAALAKRHSQHCFIAIHPPVVPYGARSTWNLYSSAKDQSRREKLLELLGKQNAYVLGGHIHKFNTLTRTTRGGGKFVQLAVSSVVGSAETKPKDILSGLKEYTGDQIRVEPKHAPETEQTRRAVYDTEREFVKSFEYADLPGHTVISINGPQVTAKIHTGLTREVWRTVDLTELLKA